MTTSVIIPTHNRPARLAQCLAALAAQDTRDFEVIVVDDASNTPLDPVVAPFRNQLQLTLLRQPHGGPAKARNAGARIATGEILLFTDDDCEADPGWVRLLSTKLQANPGAVAGAMAGGKTLNKLPQNPHSAAAQYIIDIVYRHYNANPQRARFFASNNFGLSATTFHALHGFDESYPLAAGEDRDLCERCWASGHPLLYIPEAIIHHSHPMTLARFTRVHFNYGRGAANFHRRNTHRDLGLHASVAQWFLAPLRELPLASALHRMALLVLWQFANLAGFLYERARDVIGSKVTRVPLR